MCVPLCLCLCEGVSVSVSLSERLCIGGERHKSWLRGFSRLDLAGVNTFIFSVYLLLKFGAVRFERPESKKTISHVGTLLASVGDDCRVFVWRFPSLSAKESSDTSSLWGSLVFSATVTDKLLTGVVFEPLGGSLAVTAYDSNELLVFPFKGV